MAYVDFITALHRKTPRNYLERVSRGDKAHCSQVARQFGKDYWDGDRKYGYGGFAYDGRWKLVAEQLIAHYGLKEKSRILDVGCGKGFLLYEIRQILPGSDIHGVDISDYALENAKPEIQSCLRHAAAQELPFEDHSFDLVISLTTLHNLYVYDLEKAIREIERVGKGKSYIVVESYRNEEEKANLLAWQLTCECFYTPEEWEWIFRRFGYTGDYSFIFFE